MDFLYKTTTRGRAVIAACMHLEQPVKITRVAFGRGTVPEGTELADVHELLDYVSDGTIASRSHEDDRFTLTIQYANNEHPDVKKMFYLSEFMVFVENPETGEETDLLYGTLGDYRQPVPAFKASRPPSVFNFPLTVIISSELNISVAAPAGLVTYDDLADMKKAGLLGTTQRDIEIPATDWKKTGTGLYPYSRDIPVDGVTERMIPGLTVLEEGDATAVSCGLCPRIQTLDGVVRVFAVSAPEADIPASLTLQGDASGLILSGGTGGGSFEMPAATDTTLGGVMVKPGSGLNISPDGALSIDTASEAEVQQMLTEVFTSDSK